MIKNSLLVDWNVSLYTCVFVALSSPFPVLAGCSARFHRPDSPFFSPNRSQPPYRWAETRRNDGQRQGSREERKEIGGDS